MSSTEHNDSAMPRECVVAPAAKRPKVCSDAATADTTDNAKCDEPVECVPCTVLETSFSGRIQGGCMFAGPAGVLLVEKSSVPEWMRRVRGFDMSEVEDADEVGELEQLLASGKAKWAGDDDVRCIHVGSAKARQLLPEQLSDDSDGA